MSAPAVAHSDEVFEVRRSGHPDVEVPGCAASIQDRLLRRRDGRDLAQARGLLTGLALGVGAWSALLAAAALSIRLL